jgi:hypothetical protein
VTKCVKALLVTTALAALPLLSIAGCGSGQKGPKIYKVSGSVEYGGQPVPKGFVTFIPNTKKGNSGPGGGAEIKDGKFETADGKGVVGGAYIVQIRGSDGIPTKEEGEDVPDGKELFAPYQVEVDFPTEDIEKDFTVPQKGK